MPIYRVRVRFFFSFFSLMSLKDAFSFSGSHVKEKVSYFSAQQTVCSQSFVQFYADTAVIFVVFVLQNTRTSAFISKLIRDFTAPARGEIPSVHHQPHQTNLPAEERSTGQIGCHLLNEQ